MNNFLCESDRKRLEKHFNAGAGRVETSPEHWIHGHDEGMSYCHACATAKVAELLADEPEEDYCVDGGWGTEGDSTPFCEVCGKMLSNSFTNYACESELDHFCDNGFDAHSDEDCYSLERCIAARGWLPFGFDYSHMKEYERNRQEKYLAQLHELGRAILKILDNPRPREDAKAAHAKRNAQRSRGHRRSYWWRVYRRWTHSTPVIDIETP